RPRQGGHPGARQGACAARRGGRLSQARHGRHRLVQEGGAMSDVIVRVRDLHKYFRRGSEQIDVLIDLSLDVQQGEFLALMGPSGSGKTTLLNLIAGLDQPSAGEVVVGDEVISAMSESRLAKWRTRHVGFV